MKNFFGKSPVLKAFLGGVAFGMGMTVLSLYVQKPGFLFALIESTAEMGRARRKKKEKNRFLRDRLKQMGFSDKEIDENL